MVKNVLMALCLSVASIASVSAYDDNEAGATMAESDAIQMGDDLQAFNDMNLWVWGDLAARDDDFILNDPNVLPQDRSNYLSMMDTASAWMVYDFDVYTDYGDGKVTDGGIALQQHMWAQAVDDFEDAMGDDGYGGGLRLMSNTSQVFASMDLILQQYNY